MFTILIALYVVGQFAVSNQTIFMLNLRDQRNRSLLAQNVLKPATGVTLNPSAKHQKNKTFSFVADLKVLNVTLTRVFKYPNERLEASMLSTYPKNVDVYNASSSEASKRSKLASIHTNRSAIWSDTKERKSVQRKQYNTNKIDTVTYSEDEVQAHLKEIHEQGETIIGLQHDECKQRLPQCLIIGNFKCGTQELLEFMFMHPRIRIYREPLFELHFFTGYYGKGNEWYRKQMPCSYGGQITVEKSPDYYQDPRAPDRIYTMNPNMKLIAMVRDPIERAISHFSFNNATAKEYGYQLDRCVFNSRGEINRYCFVITNSIYNKGINHYLKVFNKSQIMIINNDDFHSNPYKILYEIENFLGIEHVIDKKYFAFIEDKGFYCVRSVTNSSRVACYDHRRGQKNKYNAFIRPVSNSTIKRLRKFFKPYNDRFFQEIGQTFDWKNNALE